MGQIADASAWAHNDLIQIWVARSFTAARKLQDLVIQGRNSSELLRPVEEPLDKIKLAIDP